MTDWAAVIRRVAPNASPRVAAMIIDHADQEFERRNLRSMRRQASIIAHMAVETQYFTRLDENLNYSAERLPQVWPRRFRSATEARALGVTHNPKALALAVYNGRMGNRKGTDDGWIFRGKGLLQCTGRDNTERLAKELGVSAELAADWLVHPDHALACACILYNMLNVGPAADAGDMTAQTKRINGGAHGLAERQAAYNRAMRALSAQTAATVVGVRSPLLDGDAALDKIDAKELRDAGSRTIAAADQVRDSLSGVATAGATVAGLMSQTQEVVTQAKEATVAVKSGAPLLEVLKDYWMAVLLVVALIALGWCFIRAMRGANKVIEARVDDARTGANVGR